MGMHIDWMRRASIVLVALLLAEGAGSVASAAPPTCFGRPATIVGGPGNNSISGTDGDDVIVARGGDDEIYAGAGADFICGGAGNDILHGAEGRDEMDAGRGLDLVTYYDADAGIFVDLRDGRALEPDGREVVLHAEAVRGSQYDDRVYGTGTTNSYEPKNGRDVFYGRGGRDFYREDGFNAGRADDTFRGGPGIDTFRANPYTITDRIIDLRRDLALGRGRDRIPGVENVAGAGGNDSIIGDAGPNVIIGSGGADSITGLTGNDRLSGGGRDATDRLHGGAGRDTCFKGEREKSCEIARRVAQPKWKGP